MRLAVLTEVLALIEPVVSDVNDVVRLHAVFCLFIIFLAVILHFAVESFGSSLRLLQGVGQ